jgi:isoquinoline 1-oxidoreductase beta subunit
MEINKHSRRDFLVKSSTLGAGLTVAFYMPTAVAKTVERLTGQTAVVAPEMNAFLRIAPDDTVTVILKHLEMGQGVYTGLPMILAEELGADWSKIRVETAPANGALYGNLIMGGMQGTGGSSSVANSWMQLRQAGASAREMLIDAAAVQMKVPRTELRAENGQVVHKASGKSLSFGKLASDAAKMPAPKELQLKAPKDFTIIGKDMARLDNNEKTSGQAGFSLDMRRPNQLVVLLARSPKFGGKLKSVNDKAAKAIPGVKDVLKVPQGVAVIAENFWAAKKGREALKITWDDKAAFVLSTDQLRKQYQDLFTKPGAVAKNTGDVKKAAEKSTKKISAEFEFPYLAHAPMEPLNCVIEYKAKDKQCEIWSGSQMQTMDQGVAAKILNLKPTDVKIHTLFAGGSFGRRATPSSDLIVEAASIAAAAAKKKNLAGHPLHLMWTREDDVRGGYYRPYFLHKVEAGLGSNKKPSFWNQRIVGQSIMAGTPFAAFIQNGVDGTSVEGASDMPYDVESLYVDLHSPTSPVPVLWLRSVGHTHTAFVTETIIDELATLAGEDPVEYRLDLLKKNPRHAAVLKLAAEKAGWKKKIDKGYARGVALHESFNTIVAAVVEVSNNNGVPRVERVVCALDCGTVVNPDNVRAQIEGGIGFGLSVALHGELNFDKGNVVESNFHDYKVLRMDEMPTIEVHTIASTAPPTGVGEPGVPVLAPAMANAFAKLTGKRLRRLPFKA